MKEACFVTVAFVRWLEAARWSLVPSFSKELKRKYATFNARSEGLATSSALRASCHHPDLSALEG